MGSFLKVYSGQVLSIGCEFSPPKGGVAQVLYNYSQFIFDPFNIIVDSKSGSTTLKLLVFIKACVILVFRLLSNKYKIVHIHTSSYNSFKRSSYFLAISKFFHKKVVLHIHGGGFVDFYKTNPKWITKVLDKADCIITLSMKWKQYFETITSIPTVAIVENLIPPVDEIQKDSCNDNKVHLLFLGLITEEKGIFDLLKLVSEKKSFFYENNAVFHIAGNGEVDRLLELIDSYNLGEIVKFEGWVAGEHKINLLKKMDAFILPSYAEGLPLSILEAMSFSLPIIATNVGGIPEIVENNINGYLISPKNNSQLFEAISKIVAQPELREQMGKSSYRRATSYFPNTVAVKLSEIYKNLLDV